MIEEKEEESNERKKKGCQEAIEGSKAM